MKYRRCFSGECGLLDCERCNPGRAAAEARDDDEDRLADEIADEIAEENNDELS